MKITKTYLRQVIKEELSAVLQEGFTLETSPYGEKIKNGLRVWERFAGLHKPEELKNIPAGEMGPIGKDIYGKLKIAVANRAGPGAKLASARHLSTAMNGALGSILQIMADAARNEQLGLYNKEDYQKFVDAAEKELDRAWRSDAQGAGEDDPYRMAAQIRWGFADLLKKAYEYKKDASTTGDPMGSIEDEVFKSFRKPTEKEKPGMFSKLKGLMGLEEDLDL